jgi:hypothetical protein
LENKRPEKKGYKKGIKNLPLVSYSYSSQVSTTVKLLQSVPTEFAFIDNFINQINTNINTLDADNSLTVLLYCYLYYSNDAALKCIEKLLPTLEGLNDKVTYNINI